MNSIFQHFNILARMQSMLYSLQNKISKRTKKALSAYKNMYFLRCHKCGNRHTLIKLSGDKYGCERCYGVPKLSRRERRNHDQPKPEKFIIDAI